MRQRGEMDLQLAELGAPARETRREAACLLPDADEDILENLERRLGRLHARQRIGIEDDHEARMLGRGLGFFHPRKWRRSPTIIRGALKLTGLYRRARKNAERIQIRHQDILLAQLPPAFDGFTLLQISDLHVDLNEGAMQRLIELLPGLAYDLCVLTGDYRGKTFGPFDATIAGMARVSSHLLAPIYGVLGNHDSIRMVPAWRRWGSACCSTRPRRSSAAVGAFIWSGSMTLTTTGSTASKRPYHGCPMMNFRSCCRIPPRSIAKRRMPILICCLAGTPTAARSACQARSQSR
jgi:hypothetical protein